MAGDGGNGAGEERRWADLPGDLLGTIYLRSATAYDRARFAAVCPTWRAAASWHRPLPALPLLLPSTGNSLRDREARAYSPEDGRALRVPLPWFPWGNRLVGSHDGGWIATASGSQRLLVVNLFSGARVPLSVQQSAIVCACPVSMWNRRYTSAPLYVNKIICSTDPSSSSCILAAITEECCIALCRVGCNGRWRTRGCRFDIAYGHSKLLKDIAFVNGELYGITHNELFKFDISMDEEGNPMASPVHHLDIQMNNALQVSGVTSNPRYIFQLGGKLAIAVEVWPGSRRHEAKFFKVFELADGGTMLEEVTSLNEYTLFLGQACSKAVPVLAMDGRGGVEKNRIYYSEQHSSFHNNVVEHLARLDVGGCTLYYCESEGVHHLERIRSCGYYYDKWDGSNGCNTCMWLLPPHF